MENRKLQLKLPFSVDPKMIFVVSLFAVSLLLLPVMLCCLIILILFKKIVKYNLEQKYGKSFAGMAEGNDVVWSLEEENSKSIVNLLHYIEIDDHRPNTYLLDITRKGLQEKLIDAQKPFDKMIFKRKRHLGYCFWEKMNSFDCNDFVRTFEFPDDCEEVDETNLKEMISSKINSPLPFDNTGLIEFYVGTKPVKGLPYSNPNKKVFPVLYRLHHSLGDGVTIAKLIFHIYGIHVAKNSKLSESNSKNLYEKFKMTTMTKIMIILKAILYTPWVAIKQVMKTPDDNVLHGPELTGDKIFAWKFDKSSGDTLLEKTRKIKSRIPGITFSEIILTAISASFNRYFIEHEKEKKVPSEITSVITSRVGFTNFNVKSEIKRLENNFTMSQLTIPITENSQVQDKELSLHRRILAVKKYTKEAREAPDYLINFYLMKFAGSILPGPIFRKLFPVKQATLTTSNMPGPAEIYYADDARLLQLMFCIPTMGTIGIGLSQFTYNNGLHFGLIIDSALVKDLKYVDRFLDDIVSEIEHMDQYTSRKDLHHKGNQKKTA